MLVTELGITIPLLLKEPAFWNAPSLIVVKAVNLAKSKDVKFEHPLNAFFPIEDRDERFPSAVNVLIDVQFSKQDSPNVVVLDDRVTV